MWKCHKCGKPVYFAERKQSLGHDWHPECLRCEECSKRLNPGQHAEHKGVPYCDIPCYSVLFGPTLFGHGSQVEAHTSFGKIGKMEKKLPPGIDRAVLESKLKAYNQYYEGNSGQLKWKERNGKLILEGVLRIHWGVNNLIHLKENEDQRHHVQVRKRYSYREHQSNRRGRNSESGPGRNSQAIEGDVCHGQPTIERHSTKDEPSSIGNMDTTNTEGPKEDGRINNAVGEVTSNSPVKELMVGENNSKLNGDSNQEAVTKTPSKEVDDDTNVAVIVGANSDMAPHAAESHEHNDFMCAGSDVLRYDIINEPEDLISSCESVLKTGLNKVPNGLQRDQEIARDLQLSDDDDDEVNQPKRERINVSRVQIRKLTSSRSKTKLRRRCSINGHYYNRETKTFTPPHGSATNVWVTSMVNTSEVINLLLDKFCVENSPEDFALFIVRDNGEIRMIKEDEYPLLARVLLGPHEEVVKVFIMDKKQTDEVSNEVAQYLNFQDPELNAILHKFYEEENREVKKIKLKYAEMRRRIRAKLAVMDASR